MKHIKAEHKDKAAKWWEYLTSLNWSFIPFQTNKFLYIFHAQYEVEEDDATDDTDEDITEPDEENWKPDWAESSRPELAENSRNWTLDTEIWRVRTLSWKGRPRSMSTTPSA